MLTNIHPGKFTCLFYIVLFGSQLKAEDSVQAYFSNDSLNGFKISDAYETHNMGLLYSTDDYYIRLDLGILSPNMLVYRNQYREPDRSFGELVSVEIGETQNGSDEFRFYTQIKATGEFGIDKLQDIAHRLLSLQPVNAINKVIRMPENAWFGVGLRREFEPSLLALREVSLALDGFVGSDTTFLKIGFIKEIHSPMLTYDFSIGGRFVAYDRLVSAPPVNAKERSVIPEISFGVSYDIGPYNIFVRDAFSMPTIKESSDFFGVLSAGLSYNF